jgi:hypothetical protein
MFGMLNGFTKIAVELRENSTNYEQLFMRCRLIDCKVHTFLTCKFSTFVSSNGTVISIKVLLRIFVIMWSGTHSRMSCLLFDVRVCGTIKFANLRQIGGYLCLDGGIFFVVMYVSFSLSSLQETFMSTICITTTLLYRSSELILT